MKPVNLICLTMNINSSDDELIDYIKKLLPICKETQIGSCFAIDGYDDDVREIWEIPETLNFLNRLLKIGFMSVLEVSTTSNLLVRKDIFKTDELPGLGALELWMAATRRMGYGANEVTKEELNIFLDELEKSNKLAESYIKKPFNGYNKAKS